MRQREGRGREGHQVMVHNREAPPVGDDVSPTRALAETVCTHLRAVLPHWRGSWNLLPCYQLLLIEGHF